VTDIVERLRQRDEYDAVLDHANRPYGLAKSLEHDAAAEIERVRAERDEAIDQRNAADFVLASALAMIERRSAQRDAARAEVERLNEALIRERHGWQAEVERLRREVLRAGGAS
jgi:hypothetical protein